ncbi:MAG: GTP cyclohydrolase I FolE [Spirochaetaceae bacterium]|nr:GTP cyclohydrolase I FolE [Spirochaetaceae bacterium]
MNKERVQQLIEELLVELGEDPKREGLLKTPERVAKSWEYLTRGYHQNLENVINGAIFESESNNMVIVKDIEVYSLCEHHMLPFYGKCHIGYISRGKVLGVSKLARIADMFSRRLQIQERLNDQIARAVMDTLAPEGVGVVMECKHMCMMMRGVGKQNSLMTTSSVLGSFHDDEATRTEFLRLVGM